MQIRTILFLGALLSAAAAVHAGDADIKLTTNNGTTKFTIQDSGSVEVSSVTSDGDAYFNSITQTGAGGNLILNQSSLQSSATFYVSSGTVAQQLRVGDVLSVGNAGATSDNYIALPFIAAAAITAKQAVIMDNAGQINTNTVNSTNTIVGIAVTATSGAGQKVYVAVSGIVTNVTCQAALGAGAFACMGGTTAGRIGTCSSFTNAMLSIGRMVTACGAGGTGTLMVMPR